MAQTCEVFFVAGEVSGDRHAAPVAAELLAKGYRVTGVGGAQIGQPIGVVGVAQHEEAGRRRVDRYGDFVRGIVDRDHLPDRVGVLVGAEGPGLSGEAMASASGPRPEPRMRPTVGWCWVWARTKSAARPISSGVTNSVIAFRMGLDKAQVG